MFELSWHEKVSVEAQGGFEKNDSVIWLLGVPVIEFPLYKL